MLFGGESQDDLAVPPRLTWAAAVALRVLVVAAAIFLLAVALWRLRVVVLPCFLALFLATVLHPPTEALKQRDVPPLPSALGVMLAAFGTLGLVGWLIVPPFIDQFGELGEATEAALDDLRNWLETGPLGIDAQRLDEFLDAAGAQMTEGDGSFLAGALAGAATAVEIVIGIFVTIVLTFFVIKDGDRMVQWLLDELPDEPANDLRHIGRRGWTTLGGYFRGVTIDGLVEAVLIGLGLVLLGVPLALPLAVITFFGGFFPLVGALVAGALAASVALVSEGPVVALMVIALAVVVQNIASNVLDPLIMSRTVRIHPALVLIAVTSGAVLGGIIGAFIAVPLTAVALNIADYYLHDKPQQNF